ncbi:MAG: hypothetical protein JEZ08_06100 [Clostridiales bacterium]|nr:hypothetical protein [Clostridiales bacterium]
MNKEFDKMQKILKKEFGKHRKMYLATSFNDIPKVKIVNTYYWDKSFYLITLESSDIVQEIINNQNVCLCTTASFHKFYGEGIIIGHPLKVENKEIRDLISGAKSNWYAEHCDESDPELCLIQVKLTTAFTYANKIGYNVNFGTNELESFCFTPFS